MAKNANQTRMIDDPEWLKWVQTKIKRNLETMPELIPLQEKLLSFGGDWVALEQECCFEELMKNGQIIKGKIIMKPMEKHKCHSNCAQLWDKHPKTLKIATGWALSSDGIWRQHTWLLNGETIIETTEPRTMYYGIVLSSAEANMFWWQNR